MHWQPSVEAKIAAKSGYEEGFLIVTFYIKSPKVLKGKLYMYFFF